MKYLYPIYSNLYKLLKMRKLTINNELLNAKDFETEITDKEFVEIDCTRQSEPMLAFLYGKFSRHLVSTDDFKRHIERIIKKKSPKSLLFIFDAHPDKLTIFKNLTPNKIKNYLNSMKEIFIEYYDYRSLTINLPKHILWSKHEIAEPQEVEQMMQRIRKSLESLPEICRDDPGVMWIGARPGDVVKITRESEMAGEAIVYRRVTKKYALLANPT